MSMLKMMQEQRQLPERAFLFFWDIVELVGDDSGETHVVFSDSPETGGYDESSTRKQLACTGEYLSSDQYRIVPSSKREALIDSIYNIGCPECRRIVENIAHWSGLLEDE